MTPTTAAVMPVSGAVTNNAPPGPTALPWSSSRPVTSWVALGPFDGGAAVAVAGVIGAKRVPFVVGHGVGEREPGRGSQHGRVVLVGYEPGVGTEPGVVVGLAQAKVIVVDALRKERNLAESHR